MRNLKKHNSAAFSLVELTVIVMLIGIMALIAIPRMNFSAISRQDTQTTVRKIVTDLRRTRSLAISNAENNSTGFALNITGGNYEIENLDTSETVDSQIIASSVNCSGGSEFKFGPLGNLLNGSDTSLTVSGSGKNFTISIVSATGAIKCVEN